MQGVEKSYKTRVSCSLRDSQILNLSSHNLRDCFDGILKDRYSGQYDDQKRHHGVGTMCFVNGEIYEGQWRDGLHHGIGKLTQTNGDHYEGGWRFGKKHGKGTDYYAGDGVRIESNWKDGKNQSETE